MTLFAFVEDVAGDLRSAEGFGDKPEFLKPIGHTDVIWAKEAQTWDCSGANLNDESPMHMFICNQAGYRKATIDVSDVKVIEA